MNFSRIDLLPLYNANERRKSRERWEDDVGRGLYEQIIGKIREGAGEDFLQWDFEKGRLGFLKDYWDLAGIQFSGEDITFPNGDNFENIDFSYAQFWHSKFVGACFPQTHFAFARLYNVTFKNGVFAFAHFYGCELEKCTFEDCDFVDENGFSNCDFIGTKFVNCFFNKNKFMNCRFDENVEIVNRKAPLLRGLLTRPVWMKDELTPDHISGIYRGIKDGFLDGEIFSKARHYAFLQRQAYTRYNKPFNVGSYIWEFVAGYGTKPLRVLIVLCAAFGLSFAWFLYRLGNVSDSLLLGAGAFLTFGAKTELLARLSLLDHVIYIVAAFCGVALIALFITVLTSVLLKEN